MSLIQIVTMSHFCVSQNFLKSLSFGVKKKNRGDSLKSSD